LLELAIWCGSIFNISAIPPLPLLFLQLKCTLQDAEVNMVEHQFIETNVMQFFSLLIIKGLYMFPALLAYPQELLHKRHLVYCVRVMSVGCIRIGTAN
jgi:hypothetical protein